MIDQKQKVTGEEKQKVTAVEGAAEEKEKRRERRR